MRFCKLTMDAAPGVVLGIVACPDEIQRFQWMPNTGLWHRDTALERDIFGESFHLDEVSMTDALALRRELPLLDRRNSDVRQMLTDIESAPVADTLNDAQVGVPVQDGDRPLSGPGTRTWLAKLAPGETVPVALYPREQEHRARSLASDIRAGHRRSLAGANWEAQLIPAQGGWLVVVTKQQAAGEGTEELSA